MKFLLVGLALALAACSSGPPTACTAALDAAENHMVNLYAWAQALVDKNYDSAVAISKQSKASLIEYQNLRDKCR